MTVPFGAEIAAGLGDWLERPLERVSPEISSFWEGLTAHEFRLCRCSRCGTHYFPFTACIRHPDIPEFSEMDWVATSGRGSVFAHVVVRQVTDPAFAGEVPYVLGLVELDEGPLFPARIVACAPEDVSIGANVEVRYLDVLSTRRTWPLFVLSRTPDTK